MVVASIPMNIISFLVVIMEKVTDSQYELAELYKEEEILWNISNSEYFNKNKRKDALKRIGDVIGLDGEYSLSFCMFLCLL